MTGGGHWTKFKTQKNLKMSDTKFLAMSGASYGSVRGSVQIRAHITFEAQKHQQRDQISSYSKHKNCSSLN